MSENGVIPVDRIENIILVIRGRKVILDRDLAQLYNVTTKRLNEQVRRNHSRFPDDFIFRLTAKEKAKVVANCDHLSTLKFSPSLPYVFTEHGAIMAASVINSPRAIEASIFVVRAFVRLRKMVETHAELLQKVGELEHRLEGHDQQLQTILEAIRQLMAPTETKKKIGFTVKEKQKAYGKSMPKAAQVEFSLIPQAQEIWDAIPGDFQMKILNNVWCRTCSDTTGIGSVSGKVEKGMLILDGICTHYGNPVARVIENE